MPVVETIAKIRRAHFVQQRNLVLVGGTGTGKTHLAVGIVSA